MILESAPIKGNHGWPKKHNNLQCNISTSIVGSSRTLYIHVLQSRKILILQAAPRMMCNWWATLREASHMLCTRPPLIVCTDAYKTCIEQLTIIPDTAHAMHHTNPQQLWQSDRPGEVNMHNTFNTKLVLYSLHTVAYTTILSPQHLFQFSQNLHTLYMHTIFANLMQKSLFKSTNHKNNSRAEILLCANCSGLCTKIIHNQWALCV